MPRLEKHYETQLSALQLKYHHPGVEGSSFSGANTIGTGTVPYDLLVAVACNTLMQNWTAGPGFSVTCWINDCERSIACRF